MVLDLFVFVFVDTDWLLNFVPHNDRSIKMVLLAAHLETEIILGGDSVALERIVLIPIPVTFAFTMSLAKRFQFEL